HRPGGNVLGADRPSPERDQRVEHRERPHHLVDVCLRLSPARPLVVADEMLGGALVPVALLADLNVGHRRLLDGGRPQPWSGNTSMGRSVTWSSLTEMTDVPIPKNSITCEPQPC